MTTDHLQEAVGLTGVIDVLSRVAADAAVDAPISVETADVNPLLTSDPPDNLIAGYSLTDIFGNFVPFAERFRRETTLSVDGRLASSDSGHPILFHAYFASMWKVRPTVTPAG